MAAYTLHMLYSAIFGGDVSHAPVLGPVWVTGLAEPWATTMNTWPRPSSLIPRALHFGAVYKGAHCPWLCSLSQVHLAATMAFVFGNPLPHRPGEQLTCKRLVQRRTKNALWARDRPRPDPEWAGPPRPALRNWAAAGQGVEALGFSLTGGTGSRHQPWSLHEADMGAEGHAGPRAIS